MTTVLVINDNIRGGFTTLNSHTQRGWTGMNKPEEHKSSPCVGWLYGMLAQ